MAPSHPMLIRPALRRCTHHRSRTTFEYDTTDIQLYQCPASTLVPVRDQLSQHHTPLTLKVTCEEKNGSDI